VCAGVAVLLSDVFNVLHEPTFGTAVRTSALQISGGNGIDHALLSLHYELCGVARVVYRQPHTTVAMFRPVRRDWCHRSSVDIGEAAHEKRTKAPADNFLVVGMMDRLNT
jgi:hypothetical protein